MDFDLTKPQKLLQNSVREFCSRECSAERVRNLMETPTAFDEELWKGLADQGWTGLTVPEKWEGLELGAVELAAVAEMMGQYCLPGPFISNVWGSALIAAAGNDSAAEQYLAPIVDGEIRATVALLEESADWNPERVALKADRANGGYWLDGTKMFVSDAETAGVILCVGRLDDELAIFTLDRNTRGMTISPMPAIDQTRKLCRVEFAQTPAGEDQLLARGDAAASALHAATREATVAVCAELVGAMQWIMSTTVEYAKTREQFGKPIGSFQAVAHRCADLLLYLESSRSAAYYAAWAVSVDDPEADRAVSIAKAYCSDAAREVGNSGVQVHGGIGFTWEHDLHLYYKRAKSSEILFGDATYHRELIAKMIIDQ